ncbi:hypothetical protein P7C73_g3105, partial [Tremellales sp. Uapishka_1]
METQEEISALSLPTEYLSSLKFSRKLAKCPRTSLPVSYGDFGDPDGVPVLFIPPSGCTRWFGALQVLLPIVDSVTDAYKSVSTSLSASFGYAKSLFASAQSLQEPPSIDRSAGVKALWGPQAQRAIQSFIWAENMEGLTSEHMICLDRNGANTGPVWFESTVQSLADQLRRAASTDTGEPASDTEIPARLKIDVWWGAKDGMVPRNGHLWLNELLRRRGEEIQFEVHNVPDGDHTDLLHRKEGICEVYQLVLDREEERARVSVSERSSVV